MEIHHNTYKNQANFKLKKKKPFSILALVLLSQQANAQHECVDLGLQTARSIWPAPRRF